MEEPVVAEVRSSMASRVRAILHAFRNPIRAYDVGDGMAMLMGPAPNAGLLEVGVVSGTEAPVILHAMRARRRFLG